MVAHRWSSLHFRTKDSFAKVGDAFGKTVLVDRHIKLDAARVKVCMNIARAKLDGLQKVCNLITRVLLSEKAKVGADTECGK